jgi:hypothetical protein
MDFTNFTSVTFPRDEEIVYVLCFRRPRTTNDIPFYVGESGRGARRLSDYITAQFAAPTDFKVGTVVKVLQAEGAEVSVKFKISNDRKNEEKSLILEIEKHYPLLNHERSFNYKTDDRSAQLMRFEGIASALLAGTHPMRAVPNV